jgi:hypothetical protein
MRQLLLWAILLLSVAIAPCHAATQFDFLLAQVRTSTTSLAGGKVYFYAPGTTTGKTVWLDHNQWTIAANPYTLDTNGTAQVYGSGIYRIVIKDSSGVTKFDRDGIVTAASEDVFFNAVDATAGNQTFILPISGITTVCKTDNTANTVAITPSSGGQTVPIEPLSVGGECVRLGLIGSAWYVQ